MRTFTRCLVVMAALVALTVPAWSQPLPAPAAMVMTKADSLVQIDKLARKIAAANFVEYPDPYRIPIGVFIRVPNIEGPDAFYKTEAWQFGKLGCFWHIAAWHLYNKRMDPPEVAPPPAPVIKAGMDFSAMFDAILALLTSIPWWVWVLLAIGVALAIADTIYRKRRERRQAEEQARIAAEEQARLAEEQRMDYRNDSPVVAGGLSDDTTEALRQIQAATTLYHEPGRQVVSGQPGQIRSTDGRERVAVRIEHTGPNGLESADRWLNNGDRCMRVMVSMNGAEPAAEYWLRHCGNRFGELRDGQFQLPDGWEFIPTGPAVAMPAATTQPAGATDEVTTATNGRNGQARRDEKFTAKIVITTNGGSTPKTRQVIDVTADRFVTAVTLPDGAKVNF